MDPSFRWHLGSLFLPRFYLRDIASGTLDECHLFPVDGPGDRFLHLATFHPCPRTGMRADRGSFSLSLQATSWLGGPRLPGEVSIGPFRSSVVSERLSKLSTFFFP